MKALGMGLNRAVLTGALAMALCAGPAQAQEPLPMGNKPDAVARQVARVDAANAKGAFRPDWGSLQSFRVPEWFRDAKFGIFIHWGPYSVPGFANEWYSRNLYDPRNVAYTYHSNVFGPQSRFGYKDFIPQFTAQKFDAASWVALFRDAGARYVIPVAEHCDGFAMYDSDMTEWSVAHMGPRRDTARELMVAARAAGLHFGLSSHRAEHWWWYNVGRTYESDVNDPRYAGLYGPAASPTLPADGGHAMPNPSHLENWSVPSQAFLDDWLARSTEIVDKYKPELIYLDWWTAAPAFEPYLQRLAAYYYNKGKANGQGVALTYKGEQFMQGTALFDVERGGLDALRLTPWQTDTSVSIHSWGYAQNDEYRSPRSLVSDLIDIVSKNGNLLLNVGPRADGTIPDEARKVLTGIGAWLKVNGEAIYGTRPWQIFGEGPTNISTGEMKESPNRVWTGQDFRFTTKAGALYAIGLQKPEGGAALIRTLYTGSRYLDRPVAGVTLLGGDAPLRWEQTDKGLRVTLPEGAGADMPYTLKITFS